VERGGGEALGLATLCPHREIAQDAAVYADPRDVGSIADAIVRACCDDDLRDRLAVAGPIRAQQFAPERVARAWRSLHEELAS
jgi:glycosyltransferase involved in cell wall biosynthesis